MDTPTYTINCRGRLIALDEPKVMGILNVTPDSFFPDSRTQSEEAIAARLTQMAEEGADIIDVGAYSSRPGAENVPAEEEMARLRKGIGAAKRICPGIPVSVDTFRADVAKMAVEECGADIINDIAGGEMDKRMFRTVARLGVPYILTHIQGTPETMQRQPHYDCLRREVTLFLAERTDALRDLGVSDVIIDPGFGFGKTLEHNYELMAHLEDFHALGAPLLVGVSRKSMIYKLLGGTPSTALNGTTALNTIALAKGAHILRVHDVRAADEAKRIHCAVRRWE